MTEFAELDQLALLIHAAIVQREAEGQISPEEWGGPPPRFNGYCARSCRSYRCLVRSWPEARALSRYPDARIRRDPYSDHFWLVVSAHRVLDLNYADGEDPAGDDFDYDDAGSGESFQRKRGDGRYPARRDAQLIMDTVLENIRRLPTRSQPVGTADSQPD